MVLVGIKTEIGKPRPTAPDEGYLEFFVDWYVKILTHLEKRITKKICSNKKKIHFPFQLVVLQVQIHILNRCIVESLQVDLFFMEIQHLKTCKSILNYFQ